MVYKCLSCGKELTEKDVPIPLYETVDKWGTQKFRGKVCYRCYTEP